MQVFKLQEGFLSRVKVAPETWPMRVERLCLLGCAAESLLGDMSQAPKFSIAIKDIILRVLGSHGRLGS